MENNCKLLVKYDGERNNNKYTIRLIFNDIKLNSLGKDTDSPSSLLSEILEDNGSFATEEIMNFFSNTINVNIENLKRKFGYDCVISMLMEEQEGKTVYTLHIQTVKGTKWNSGESYKELFEALLLEEF